MWEIRQGDCLEVMRGMADASVDAVVTDPPYGLAFMGKHWDHGLPGEAFWAEALRVAKPGAHLLAFGGTRTYHRLTCAIEDAGWEIRDCLGWLYGSGFPKSHNLKGDMQGWGTSLKPAHEPIVLARKPFKGTVAANVQAWGTGAVNVDGCRVDYTGDSDKPTQEQWNRMGSSGSVGANGFAGQFSKGMKQAYAEGKIAVPQGRWPANIIHDGSDEVMAVFPETGASSSRARNNGKFKSVAKGRDLPHITHGHDDNGGSAARFFYCAKASKADRDEGCEGMEKHGCNEVYGAGMNTATKCDPVMGHTEESVANRPLRSNHHPTVKPTTLMRYLCRLITPPNGTILDPFTGSGSTGKAAILEGFNFIGIEREPEYCEIARARIVAVDPENVFQEIGS